MSETSNKSSHSQEGPQETCSAEASASEAAHHGAALEGADTLSAKLAELDLALKEKDRKYVYLYAEFENWKKRAVKERQDAARFGWEPVARDLLQVLDNIDRALQHAPAETDKNLLAGLGMVRQQFYSTLEKQGVRPISALEQAFDPHLHEAIGQIESELPNGTVAKEEAKGYWLHDRLLRPARVFVSTGKQAQ